MLIPIPVFWTKYTATTEGSLLKAVHCENCATEYLYLLEREVTEVGTSVYNLDNEGAAKQAVASARQTLQSCLENDFDPVPCPACGHYQKYMFPKLLDSKKLWVEPVMVVVVMIGCLSMLVALYRSLGYLQQPTDAALSLLIAAWSATLLVCFLWFGLWLVKRYKIRHFNANETAQQSRIELGKSRAVTRTEFERVEEEKRHVLDRGL